MRSETILFERCAPAEIYKPPPLRSRYRNESEVPPATVKDALDINEFPKGEIRTAWINMVSYSVQEPAPPRPLALASKKSSFFPLPLYPVDVHTLGCFI